MEKNMLKPFNSEYLNVSKYHNIFFKEFGNKNGIPLLILHGGPGAPHNLKILELLNLERYRVIFMDQRGTGNSKELGETRENTTWDLIGDIEKLREFLNLEKWCVYGGSWGATLALLYGQKYPERCLQIVLRSVFLGRKKDEDWFLHKVASHCSSIWRPFAEFVREEERRELNKAYHRHVFSKDKAVSERAALSIINYMDKLAVYPRKSEFEIKKEEAIPFAKIFLHYSVNDYFLENYSILDNMEKLKETPVYIAHGELDLDCHVSQAKELKAAYNNAKLSVLKGVPHTLDHPLMKDKLKAIFQRIEIKNM